MKRCPQCQQSFSDEYSFCLSDGTPLVAFSAQAEIPAAINQSEIPTVVKPRPATRPRGRSILLFVLAALLSLSLGITAAVLYFFWPRRPAVTQNETAQTSPNDRVANRVSPAPERTATPTPTPTQTPEVKTQPTLQPDEAPGVSDPRPARITFARGRSQTSVSGSVVRQRSYLLYAAEGQNLSAQVDSDNGCVFFQNGSPTTRYVTTQGDNVLTVINDCDEAAQFRLNVQIR
ncbi:MAG TPA: hypothetical protein VFZ23_00905 [Pyrinomonadaceae bacterium]